MYRSVRRVLVLSAAVWLFQPISVADAEPGRSPRSIEASGTASVSADPDRARLVVAVSSTAGTAKQAVEATAAKMRDVVAALKKGVGPSGKVETTSYDVHAEYSFDNQGNVRRRKLEGYAATNTVAAETADLDAVGNLIDWAVASGANEIRSVGFFLSNDSEMRRRALLEAGEVARAEGEAIAESLDVELGPVLHATAVPGFEAPRPYLRKSAMMAEAAPSTEILPGAVRVEATVRVSFAIR